MSTQELRTRLIEKIQRTQSVDLLNEAYRLLEMESSAEEIHVLSKGEKEAIEQARQEIRRGEFLSNEEADAEIEKWLKG